MLSSSVGLGRAEGGQRSEFIFLVNPEVRWRARCSRLRLDYAETVKSQNVDRHQLLDTKRIR